VAELSLGNGVNATWLVAQPAFVADVTGAIAATLGVPVNQVIITNVTVVYEYSSTLLRERMLQ